MANQQIEDPEKQLNFIRLGLIAGTLFFAPLAWFVSGEVAPEILVGKEFYLSAGLILLLLGLFVGTLVARSKWQAANTFEEKRTANIIGWTLAELAALVGALFMKTGGSPAFFGAVGDGAHAPHEHILIGRDPRLVRAARAVADGASAGRRGPLVSGTVWRTRRRFLKHKHETSIM